MYRYYTLKPEIYLILTGSYATIAFPGQFPYYVSMISQNQLQYSTHGSGSPKTLIISGVHGNERTGQIIIDRLLKNLPTFSGTLTILPVANPTGFTNNTRVESVSGLDLNRNFFDSGDGPGNQIIKAILHLVRRQDFIFDLHNFKTDGLVQVVSNHIGASDTVAMLFQPDLVRTSGGNGSLKKTGTLTQYTKDANISYLLFELPIEHKLSQTQIDKILSGFRDFLSGSHEETNTTKKSFNDLPRVAIRVIKAEISGVFSKNERLVLEDIVSFGEILGTITFNETRKEIRSPCKGIVCELDQEETREVKVGDTLLAIGEPF